MLFRVSQRRQCRQKRNPKDHFCFILINVPVGYVGKLKISQFLKDFRLIFNEYEVNGKTKNKS